MRILYVIPYYKPAYVYGGPSRSVPELCRSMVDNGAEVTVLTTNANGKERLDVPLSQSINVEGVDVWYYPLALGGINFYSPKLAEGILNTISDYDILVADTLWEFVINSVVKSSHLSGVPYVIPVRGQLFPWALEKKWLKKSVYLSLFAKRFINEAIAIHCTDQAEAEAVSRLGFYPPTFVVPNGINNVIFKNLPPFGLFRKSYDIPADAVVLLFLGRLNKIKRPDIAIRTLSLVLKSGINAYLVLAGPDSDQSKPELQELVNQDGIGQRVRITGLINDEQIHRALVDANLFLMPSQVQESFGMSAVEAMAAGLPIIVSDGVPVGRLAEKAGAGRVAPYDADAFGKVVLEMLSNPEKLSAMGSFGRRLVSQKYDSGVVARQMLIQFRALLSTGKPLLNNG